MIDYAVPEEVSGDHDAERQHARELQASSVVGGIAYDTGTSGECLSQARGHKAVFVDDHYLGLVFRVDMGPQDGPAIGCGRQLDWEPVRAPRSRAARALATA